MTLGCVPLAVVETLHRDATEAHGDSFIVVRIQAQLLQRSLSSRVFPCIPELHIKLRHECVAAEKVAG